MSYYLYYTHQPPLQWQLDMGCKVECGIITIWPITRHLCMQSGVREMLHAKREGEGFWAWGIRRVLWWPWDQNLLRLVWFIQSVLARGEAIPYFWTEWKKSTQQSTSLSVFLNQNTTPTPTRMPSKATSTNIDANKDANRLLETQQNQYIAPTSQSQKLLPQE